jgi:hypothetical protein
MKTERVRQMNDTDRARTEARLKLAGWWPARIPDTENRYTLIGQINEAFYCLDAQRLTALLNIASDLTVGQPIQYTS